MPRILRLQSTPIFSCFQFPLFSRCCDRLYLYGFSLFVFTPVIQFIWRFNCLCVRFCILLTFPQTHGYRYCLPRGWENGDFYDLWKKKDDQEKAENAEKKWWPSKAKNARIRILEFVSCFYGKKNKRVFKVCLCTTIKKIRPFGEQANDSTT